MYIIYLFLKALVKLVLWIFYPKTTVVHPERLRFEYPAIVVSNHPNTLLDALHSAARVKKQVFFLANASLFSTPFQNWFFNKFYCIPIKRKQDTKGGTVNNEDSFARCDEFLGNGGCLYIAPEGGSEMERRLRKIKTGTARIALSAESKKDFQLGLKIVPIGITYEQPNQFRSAVLIRVGEPIEIKDYQEGYQQADFATAQKITERLTAEMRSLIIDVDDEEQDELVRRLEIIQQTEQPLTPEPHFQRTKKLIEELRQLQEENPQHYELLQTKTHTYFKALRSHSLSDRSVAGDKKAKPLLWLQAFLLLLGLPLFIYGWLNNYLPAKIPSWLVQRLKFYVGYDATVKAISGLVTFPLFYYLQYRLVGAWWDAPIPLIYLLSLPLLGWVALKYRSFFRKWISNWRYAFVIAEAKKQELQKLREEVHTARSLL